MHLFKNCIITAPNGPSHGLPLSCTWHCISTQRSKAHFTDSLQFSDKQRYNRGIQHGKHEQTMRMVYVMQ